MNEIPIHQRLGAAGADTLTEIVRQAEAYLDAQLTSAIAADQRAYTFAGTSSAAAVLLVGASYSLMVTAPADALLGFTALAVAAAIFVASWMAVLSARSVDFEFAGNQPHNWCDDAESGKELKLALAEQSEHYDGMIATNRQTMESNSRMFNAAVNIALAALGCGGLVFFYWMATRVG